MGASGAAAAVAIAVLLLAGGVSASAPASTTVLTAPYSGTAVHSESRSVVGCGSASDPTHPHFALATGVAELAERSAATTCPLANGTSAASAYGAAGLSFRDSGNVSRTGGNGSRARLVATWSIEWIASVAVSGNGSLTSELEAATVSATFTVEDLSTNGTVVGSADWTHTTLFNITRGSASVNGSMFVHLGINLVLVPGQLYEFTTEVSGSVSSDVSGSGSRTVTTSLDIAAPGGNAVLKSIQL